MKNHILALTAITLILTLAGCSGEGEKKQTSAPPAATEQQPAATTTPATPAAPEKKAEPAAPTATTKPAAPVTPAPATTKPATPVTAKPTEPAPTAPAVKPAEPAPVAPAPKPVATTSGNKANGAAIFKANCAGCHGNTGEGNGPAASSLKPKPSNFVAADYKDSMGKNPREYSDAELISVIQNGRKGTAMPAWKKQLTADQQNDVLSYVRSLAK